MSVSCVLFAISAAPSHGYAMKPASTADCQSRENVDPLFAAQLNTWLTWPELPLAIDGLSFITEAQLWSFAGSATQQAKAPLPVTPGFATRFLIGLRRSELFARIGLVATAAALRMQLVEHPLIANVSVTGLRESDAHDFLDHYLGSAPAVNSEGVESTNRLRFQVWRKRVMDNPEEPRCETTAPDPSLFARSDGARFLPGILRGGMEAARLRALHWFHVRGYPLAAIKVRLSPQDQLNIEVDEGRLESIEVRGVPASLRREIESSLELRRGDVLSSRWLRRALAVLLDEFPFLELDKEHSLAGEEPAQAAATAPTHDAWEALRSVRFDLGDLNFSWDYQAAQDEQVDNEPRDPSSVGNAVQLAGPGRVILWLRARPITIDVDWIQLLRHTPATGFAPGLAATLHLWDAEDRAHLALDAALAVNTKRAPRAPPPGADLFERWSASERLDWLAGARLAVPPWKLAELGVQLYALTDTNDTWRMSDTNSYLHSALLALPDRDYFRRAGATALTTFQFFHQLTLGAEYHQDRYDSLPNPRVWSLFNSDAPLLPPGLVTAAQFGSILLRAEWSSEPVPLLRSGSLYRHAEVPLSNDFISPPTFTTMATAEFADRALGSDPGIHSFHALSDSRLQLTPLNGLLLRLRLRAGAGLGLPLQLEETLGGWSALRGYLFKEFRGDISILSSAEARWRFLGAFVDLGAVHQPPGWSGVRPGVGAQLVLEHVGSLECAWRLDGNGSLVPSARALLGWDL